MDWQLILTALALALVIEGLIPFAIPARYRKMVDELARLGNNQIRSMGLVVMAAGLFLLFLIRA